MSHSFARPENKPVRGRRPPVGGWPTRRTPKELRKEPPNIYRVCDTITALAAQGASVRQIVGHLNRTFPSPQWNNAPWADRHAAILLSILGISTRGQPGLPKGNTRKHRAYLERQAAEAAEQAERLKKYTPAQIKAQDEAREASELRENAKWTYRRLVQGERGSHAQYGCNDCDFISSDPHAAEDHYVTHLSP